jgi:integrase
VSGGKPPKPCIACRQRRAAWTKPRVDYCYECLPGGPFPPPACTRCNAGSDGDESSGRTTPGLAPGLTPGLDLGADVGGEYYSQGLCTRCHPFAPQRLESCRDCHAWGVIRKHKWLCWRCHSWRARLAKGSCRICLRVDLAVNPDDVCNLCDRQMSITLGATIEAANAGGQQLYFANMPWQPTRIRWGNVRRVDQPNPRNLHRDRADRFGTIEFYPVEQIQLALFHMSRDLTPARDRELLTSERLPDPPHEQMAAFLDAAVLDRARRHGWPKSTIHRTQRSMRVLQLMQDTPGAMLLASDAIRLHEIGLTAIPVIDVATAAGVMLDDRQPAIHAWFDTTTAALPEQMRTELIEWFTVMLNGSTTPPRRHSRDQQTIRLYLRWAMPALTTWAEQGHTSLREITTSDVRDVLPSSGNPRSTMGAGLRSVLTLLKARKVIFVNPIARIQTGSHERRDPLPAHAEKIRASLLSNNPACAALTALATFHGLRASELCNLHLTDLADGRLQLGQRRILLAEPVRVRISAWLDYRNKRWPTTANPHLFLNHRNSSRTTPVGGRWLTLATGIPIHVMREDRILHEARATGGDVRRICDLFGLTVEGALRYLPEPDTDDLDVLE